jgi:hypothetical protein
LLIIAAAFNMVAAVLFFFLGHLGLGAGHVHTISVIRGYELKGVIQLTQPSLDGEEPPASSELAQKLVYGIERNAEATIWIGSILLGVNALILLVFSRAGKGAKAEDKSEGKMSQ